MAGIPGAHPTSGVFSGMAAAFSQQPSPMASPPTAVTPMMGVSSQGAPTGNSPNAKRPMDRVAIDVALNGSRIMTNEDLSAGFTNLQRLQVRDEFPDLNVPVGPLERGPPQQVGDESQHHGGRIQACH